MPVVPRALLRTAARFAEHGRDYLLSKDLSSDEPTAGAQTSPSDLLHDLLARSVRQTTREATAVFAASILKQLVPDEARMLVALEREGWSAAVDIGHRESTDVLGRVTLLGRESGIVLTNYAARYLSRLIAFGVVQETDVRADRSRDFEILLADADVLAALNAGHGVTHRPRVRRYGVELSPLGRSVLNEAAPARP